jgi:GNAT superfamily N-acetyltransferase
MDYLTLAQAPELKDKTFRLIENSFQYHSPHSFKIDFYPLIKDKNLNHCHILLDQGKVIAHIGALTKNINLKHREYSFTMFGGIAIDPHYRGKGIFKQLFTQVNSLYSSSTFHLLWSEKLELYKKFGFFPCIQLNEYDQKQMSTDDFHIEKTKLSKISTQQLDQLIQLYQQLDHLTPTRTVHDWKELSKITSTDLYLIYKKNENQIYNYFFINKGQDLAHIIHEYGFLDLQQLNLLSHYGKVWTPLEFSRLHQTLYASLLKISHHENFKNFIKDYTNIELKMIQDDKTNFTFKDHSYELSLHEFLLGIFGPTRFNEIKAPYLYIPGMESI